MDGIMREMDISLDCKDMQEAARKLLFGIATLRAEGGKLIKLRFAEGQAASLRRYLRSWRGEQLISTYTGGAGRNERVAETYLSEMYPSLLDDGDFAEHTEGIIFIAI